MQGQGSLCLQEQGLRWPFLQTHACVCKNDPATEGSFLQKRRWESSCFKIEPPRWPSKGESDGGSAWKSSLKTAKRLRLDQDQLDWKRLDQQSWSFEFEMKDHKKTGLYGPF